MHLNRASIPRGWPLPRKGKKYVVVPLRGNGVPLLIVLRDMLKLGRTRKEIKKILNEGNAAVNGKIRKDERFSVLAFDIIKIAKINKSYRIIISRGKFQIEEVKEKDAQKRIYRIDGKRIVGKSKIQLNLDNGDNILCNEKAKVGDSVVIDLNEKKIIGILPMQKGAKVFVRSGRHNGEKGEITETKDKTAIIKIGKMNVEIKKGDFIVVE